ncbi:MAG: NAD-dependent epimerase/dehydratase family protein [Nitrosotalea sp.]
MIFSRLSHYVSSSCIKKLHNTFYIAHIKILYILNKVLITGHSGFIGSNLVSLLSSKKYQITGISRKTSKNSKITEIKKDIQRIRFSDVSRNSQIIHLAAITDLSYCDQNPIECFRTNMQGTQNLLDIARKQDSKFIYVSTSHVYGYPKKLPISEEHPRNATSIYAASKIGGEVCCESYARTYGMDISILRIFSVYGPGSPAHLVIGKIISQLLANKTIRLGNLYPKRDFIYINDVVRAIEIALRKSRRFNIYNIGSSHSYSILQICDILKKLSGCNIPVKSSPLYLRSAEIPNVVSDSSKIKHLGWKPTVSIQRGLKMTLDWYSDRNRS